MAKISKIVIRMPNWLGDAVMALDALIAIRKYYRGARIVVLCKAPLSALFKNCPFIDQVFDLDLKQRFSIRFKDGSFVIDWLKQQHFCLGILFTHSVSSALLFKRGCVNKIVGYSRLFSSLLLNSSLQRSKKGALHMSEYYLRLTDFQEIARSCYEKAIHVQSEEIEHLYSQFSLTKGYVVLCPTSAFGPAKCWPIERFVLLAKRLSQKGLYVIIAAEKKLEFSAFHPKIINLSGKTNLREFIVLLHEARVVVANDSGPLHLASHMRRPLVCLFGSSPVNQASPYKGSSVIHKNVACSPCFKRVCPIDFRCMKQILVTEVYDAVVYQMSRAEKTAVAIFAGGMGQRLGLKTPKAIIDFDGTCLLEHHIKKVPDEVKIFILTSPATHNAIKQYLEQHDYFSKEIMLYSKKSLPCTNLDGSQSDATAPEGNGAFYDCIVESGFFEKYSQVEVVNCIPIDNPKSDPYCYDLIHACLEMKNEVAFSCIERNEGDAIGALVEREEGLEVVEYSDPHVENQSENIGFINLFCMSKKFILKASKKEFSWHRVERGGKVHFERWVFDPFDIINNYKIFIRDKQNYFYPLKCKDDLETVRSILYTTSEKKQRV